MKNKTAKVNAMIAAKLLSRAGYNPAKFPARAAYDAAMSAALAAYDAIELEARAKYQSAGLGREEGLAEYRAATAVAGKAYYEAKAAATLLYDPTA